MPFQRIVPSRGQSVCSGLICSSTLARWKERTHRLIYTSTWVMRLLRGYGGGFGANVYTGVQPEQLLTQKTYCHHVPLTQCLGQFRELAKPADTFVGVNEPAILAS